MTANLVELGKSQSMLVQRVVHMDAREENVREFSSLAIFQSRRMDEISAKISR